MMNPYLIGLLFGDGTSNYGKKNKAYSVWIDQHKRNQKITEKAKDEFEKMGLNVHYYSHTKNKIRAMVYSKNIYEEFQEVKNHPIKYFKKLNAKGKFNFISGFFDAEGTVTDRIVLYNGNIEILKQIQKFIAEKINVVGYVYRYGKIHGLQIYKRDHIKRFVENTSSIKISVRSSRLKNVGGC